MRTQAPWAALINGTAAHALDYDDYESAGVTHASAVLVPALLALADDRKSSGSEVLDAYLVGFEMLVRMGEGVNMSHYGAGWHATSTIGALGAAAACGRLLHLNTDRLAAAISIATSFAAGYKAQFGTMVKPLHAGLAAKSGVLAAILASGGVTASPSTLDGPWSFLTLHGGPTPPGFGAIAKKIGQSLAFDEYGVISKRFPSCGSTHVPLESIIKLRARTPFQSEEIAKIEIELPEFAYRNLMYARPTTPMEARFSMHYCAAALILRGHLNLSDFDPEAIRDPALGSLLGLIHLSIGAKSEMTFRTDITLKDGRKLGDAFAGLSPSRLSKSESKVKFLSCATRRLTEHQAAAVLTLLDDLPQLSNIQSVTSLVHPLR
jgi:2-methylcitrate dehydratase PrpD